MVRLPSAGSIVFRAEALIHGDAPRVWPALVDLPAYAAWNPWLVHAQGHVEPGGVVWAEVVLGAKRMRAKHVVLLVEPHACLCWRDAGWTTLFVYGQRKRTLESLADGTVRLRQELLLDGPLRGVAERKYGAALRAGLAAETAALKQLVEAGPAPRP